MKDHQNQDPFILNDKNYLSTEPKLDEAYKGDVLFYRIVICTVAFITISSFAICAYFSIWRGSNIPELFITGFSTSLGCLIVLIAPTKRN